MNRLSLGVIISWKGAGNTKNLFLIPAHEKLAEYTLLFLEFKLYL